jgi:hypothetical protein
VLFLNIATGVILVLLGMRYVRKGLDRLFGNQLVDWLQQMTNNRYKAFFGGMVAGAIAPSSSAIAMLSVQMLNQTALTAGRMLAVVLGANVGITVSVQLLAFRLQDYSGVFLLTGGIGFLFLKRAIFRGAGQMLLGIGLVFLAMGIIGSAGTAAAKNSDLKLLFGVVDPLSARRFRRDGVANRRPSELNGFHRTRYRPGRIGTAPRDDHRTLGVRCEPRNHAHDDDGRLGQRRGPPARYWKPFDQRLWSSGDSIGKFAIFRVNP